MLAGGVGLLCTALMVFYMKRQTDLMAEAASKPASSVPQPLSVTGTPIGNAEIARDLKNMNHRIASLESWRNELIQKLDEDKTEILVAGEHRAEKLHDRINNVLSAVSELKGRVEQINHQS